MFVWQGILLLFFIISLLLVQLLLTMYKGTCEGGVGQDRRAGSAWGSLPEGWRKVHLK